MVGGGCLGVGLKKLLELKDWVTVPEAASHLSTLFGEDVAEADILRFALEGRLTLSIYFVNYAVGRCGKVVLADAERNIPPTSGGRYDSIKEVSLHRNRVVSFSPGLTPLIFGLWDLAMFGAGRSEIKRKYHLLTGGPTPPLANDIWLDDLLINRPDGTWMLLFQDDGAGEYFPTQSLPADAILVVRTSALQALVSEPEPAMERPVGQRERDSLLAIIAALAKLAKINVAKPSAAATTIESEIRLMGARLSSRAIEDHLRRIPDALERKGVED
jgi:hypothetical protein